MATSVKAGPTPLPAGTEAGIGEGLRERLRERLLRRITLHGDGHPALAVRAPFTGRVLGSVPQGGAADVAEAVRRARLAQRGWAGRSLRERSRIVLRFHDLLLERQDEVLDLIQLETGKARRHAFEEVGDVAIVARYYAVHAARHLRPRRRRGAIPLLTAVREHHHPRGVVGFIAPWNYPLTLAVSDALPALLAGNAALLKPDNQTAHTGLWAVDLLYEAGLPEDLFQVVTGEGPAVGPPLVEACDYVSFTGSTGTGRIVARQAAERLTGCSLELGGKNAMIVLADADLERAVDGAVRGCFASAGQLCVSIERIYLHATVYERFVARFLEHVRALRLGPGFHWEAEVGSLVSERQLERVREHVRDAVARGAVVLAGGAHRPDLGPYFFEPTVLAGVTAAMRVYAEETFGPVVSLYRIDTVDEAIERANGTAYGLNASIWTRNTGLGRRLATRLQAGTVNVNEAYAAAWASVDAPLGGFKDSGLGRRHGAEGILKYTEAQTVAVQRVLPVGPLPGVSAERFRRVASLALRVLRRLPGLR